jgi:hypothetical protein
MLQTGANAQSLATHYASPKSKRRNDEIAARIAPSELKLPRHCKLNAAENQRILEIFSSRD